MMILERTGCAVAGFAHVCDGIFLFPAQTGCRGIQEQLAGNTLLVDFWLEGVSSWGGSHSCHLTRVRSSVFARVHALGGRFQVPMEVAFGPAECQASPIGSLMCSGLPFGKKQRRVVVT